MELKRKISILKWLVYIYAVILAITGLGQIILGTIILWDHIIFRWLADNEFWKPSTLLLCLGPCSLLLCWMAFASTIKNNRKILTVFSILLIASVITQIIVCIWSVKLRWALTPRSANLENSIDRSFGQFFSENSIFDSSHIWNKVQSQYKCCGVDGHTDYRRGAVPWSCFAGGGMDTTERYSQTRLHQRGCLQVLESTMKKLLLYCALVSLVSAVLQSVGLFCSIQLANILGQKVESPEVDLASMSFRQKRAHIEMLQPLGSMKGVKRQKYLSESSKSDSGGN